jgi:predicted nucleic acid-binding protein
VILRHLLDDIPEHSQRANVLFAEIMTGDRRVCVPATVFLESSYVLTNSKGVPVADAAHGLSMILGYTGLETDHSEALKSALQLWGTQGPLSFADCFHLALTRQLGMTRIVTFDQKMDRYPGVERIEP